MLRLTLMLSAAVYAGLVIYSETAPVPSETAPAGVEVTRAASAATPLLSAETTLTTEDGRALAIASVINPVDLAVGIDQVASVSTYVPDTVTASASSGVPDLPLVEVTGRAVNLRAGPSTSTQVLDALVRGERAELVASLGNGWAQIRVAATGTEGYMADRFLAPLN